MKEVTKKEFYETIGQVNVESRILGEYPHRIEVKDKNTRNLIGKITTDGRYFINENT